MIVLLVLLSLLPVLAAFALSRRRRFTAIVGMGLFSLILSAVYLLLHAPDVAVTEAAINAALITFIYIIAIRKTGKLVVVSDEIPGLLYREGEQISGLEQEILSGFSRQLGLELVIRFLPVEQVPTALQQGEADIGAGGIISEIDDNKVLKTQGYLPTALYHLSTQMKPHPKQEQSTVTGFFSDLREDFQAGKISACTLDLARFVALSSSDLSPYTVRRLDGLLSYIFLVAPARERLHHQFVSYLSELEESGELDKLTRRYFS